MNFLLLLNCDFIFAEFRMDEAYFTALAKDVADAEQIAGDLPNRKQFPPSCLSFMLTRSVALDRVNFFTAGSNLRNPFISVICGSDDEECQKHRFNGYVDELRGAEDAEACRGNLGMIISILRKALLSAQISCIF